jgi:hypothetical protein
MAEITPNTTTVQSCDDERALLMKILHRLNLNAVTLDTNLVTVI